MTVARLTGKLLPEFLALAVFILTNQNVMALSSKTMCELSLMAEQIIQRTDNRCASITTHPKGKNGLITERQHRSKK